MKFSFKEAWKETLLGAGTLGIFSWGIFNHLISVLLSLIVVFFAALKLAKKIKII